MKETSPSFQFYPEDFEGDEAVMRMTLPQIGLYQLLLCRCWREGSIPDDADAIADITRRDAARHWPAVRARFIEDPASPGRLRHLRLDHERTKQAAFRQHQSASGFKGSQRRWHSDPNGVANGVVMATHMANDSPPSPSPSPNGSTNVEPPRTARQERLLPKDPTTIPARAICEAAYPVVAAHVDLAETKTDWVKRNMNAARALHAAGKTPENVVAALKTAYEHPTARDLYGRTTSLANLQKNWPALQAHATGKVRSLRGEDDRTKHSDNLPVLN